MPHPALSDSGHHQRALIDPSVKTCPEKVLFVSFLNQNNTFGLIGVSFGNCVLAISPRAQSG